MQRYLFTGSSKTQQLCVFGLTTTHCPRISFHAPVLCWRETLSDRPLGASNLGPWRTDVNDALDVDMLLSKGGCMDATHVFPRQMLLWKNCWKMVTRGRDFDHSLLCYMNPLCFWVLHRFCLCYTPISIYLYHILMWCLIAAVQHCEKQR